MKQNNSKQENFKEAILKKRLGKRSKQEILTCGCVEVTMCHRRKDCQLS